MLGLVLRVRRQQVEVGAWDELCYIQYGLGGSWSRKDEPVMDFFGSGEPVIGQ